MLGKTHIVNAIAIASVPLAFSSTKIDIEYSIFLLLIAIGSIIPDIDEPNSILGRKLKFLSYPINIFFGHRTITHNLILFSIFSIFSIFFYIQKYNYLFALSVGILIHILQDSMTYQGIKNGLFPMQRLNYHFVLFPRRFRFAVGSITEYIILLISAIFLIAVVFIQIGLFI